MITSGQEVETCNNQVTELRRQLQALEIDLQAQLSQVGAELTDIGDAVTARSVNQCNGGEKLFHFCNGNHKPQGDT